MSLPVHTKTMSVDYKKSESELVRKIFEKKKAVFSWKPTLMINRKPI